MNFVDRAKIEHLCTLYSSGKTISEVAKAMGCNPSNVTYWLRKEGVAFRAKGKPRIPQHIQDRACALYQAGVGAVDIQNALHVTTQSIYKMLRKRNIPLRFDYGRELGSGVVDKMTPEEYGLHIEKKYPGITAKLGDLNFTLNSIGETYGLTRERVRQFEQRMGLVPRNTFRGEIAQLTKETKAEDRLRRKEARVEKWRARGERVAEVIRRGGTVEEIAAALPWKINGGGTPFAFRVSHATYQLRKLSGVDIPKRYDQRPQSKKAE